MWVTVFTNATLVQPGHCRLFHDFPPRAVEVTLYGATADTYERVTRVPGSFEKCMRGIHRLLDHGVRVCLKTMLLRSNVEELPAIEAVARRLGTSFRLDPNVLPQQDGDEQPLRERVAPSSAVALELADNERISLWKAHYLRAKRDLLPGTIYRCEAGLTGFHLDPDGKMRPCVIASKISSNALDEGFLKAWRNISEAFDGVRSVSEAFCGGCANRFLCSCCPGILGVEMDARSSPEFMCEIAGERVRAIEAVMEREEL
jgi:MoaA/NifB/PqqE/SkfB family radical SAM enzyme